MFTAEADIKVRYAETDQMGVVYHANYIIWFEIGRTALIEKLGFSYAEMEKAGVLSPVTHVEANYKKPLTYGDEATIITSVKEYNGLKVVYEYGIRNSEGDLCVTGCSTHVCVKKDTFRPISIKKRFPDWHTAYLNAAGEDGR